MPPQACAHTKKNNGKQDSAGQKTPRNSEGTHRAYTCNCNKLFVNYGYQVQVMTVLKKMMPKYLIALF